MLARFIKAAHKSAKRFFILFYAYIPPPAQKNARLSQSSTRELWKQTCLMAALTVHLDENGVIEHKNTKKKKYRYIYIYIWICTEHFLMILI